LSPNSAAIPQRDLGWPYYLERISLNHHNLGYVLFDLEEPAGSEMKEFHSSFQGLLSFCRREKWSGFDPYDALKSPLLTKLGPKWARIAATQFLRWSPVNLRPILGIRKSANPKALALFVRALLKTSLAPESIVDKEEVLKLSDWLLSLRSDQQTSAGTISWGYDFPWQSRAFYCPAFSPNIQSTIICAHAFYELADSDLPDAGQKKDMRRICRQANAHLIENLLLFEDRDIAFLRYIPQDKSIVINIQAQAAWSLLRAYLLTQERRFFELTSKLIRFVESKQNDNGSWYYGQAPYQRFIDNFHTGFILEALFECYRIDSSLVEESTLERGFAFYLDNFFDSEGRVQYYHDSRYPVDAHAVAQSIVTISKLDSLDGRSTAILDGIIQWAFRNFQSEKGFFFYQKWPIFTNRIPYMRWSQAWMLYALATYFEQKVNKG
jgi:hypothetical protein